MTTIGAWLSDAPDIPRLERELLLSAALGLNRSQIIAHPERSLASTARATLDDKLRELRAGTPLAYVLGYREFWGLELQVDSRVLVPRPETELLVELVIALAAPQDRVLDLGTGSGAIAIALAAERSDLDITATDRSQAALRVAHGNAMQHGVYIELVHSNWFTRLAGRWHLIVANPPYVAAGDPHLEALRAEPQEALVAGPDGMRDLLHIIERAPEFLTDFGYLLLEHGYDQASAVRQAMIRRGFTKADSTPDLAGIERVTSGQWGAP